MSGGVTSVTRAMMKAAKGVWLPRRTAVISKREQGLTALLGQLQRVPGAGVKRNEAPPQVVPAGELVILRGGDPSDRT